MTQNFSSHLLQRAVDEVSCLPGIGRKTALRLVLHLLRQDARVTSTLTEALSVLRNEVKYCRMCHNISDTDICEICANPKRDASTLCVVENIQDVMAIESTGLYRGLYHVLGGVISPMDGIGPSNLHIQSLVERVAAGGIREVILALSPTMEGDTTNYFIYRRLSQLTQSNSSGDGDFDDVTISLPRITVIARGVAQNDELQHTDEATLGRALAGRTPFSV
ncbi:MAG: recombination protein RecR [Bacteroidaceae bacterium]|nr:recombination protein RecR [Bacteroidaceae bacterium]MBR2459540.1 recombination protein RecR [Bacteroidaceae bacterium]